MVLKPSANPADVASGDEAKGYDGDFSATREVVADWLEWLRLPPVSGRECVQALRRARFVVQVTAAGCADLRRDGEAVQVPLVDRLSPDVLVAILIKARVGPVRFLELLDA
jgi:hypothetical protein